MARAAFPGSFNPPTVAHLAVAQAAWRQRHLERVDLIVSAQALGKSEVVIPTIDDRMMVLHEIAATRPWLGVKLTGATLLADLAEGYDWVVMGADKWAQIQQVTWYGSEAARDEALSRLPGVLVAARPPHPTGGIELLDISSDHQAVSSTATRLGRPEWMAAEAARFDSLSGAWSDPERYGRWRRSRPH